MSHEGELVVEDSGPATGDLVQQIQTSTTAAIAATTLLPADNTIPLQTEGDEILTLAITPTSATNRLFITFNLQSGITSLGAARIGAMALFQDATANAIAATFVEKNPAAGFGDSKAQNFTHSMIAGTTAPTTFKVRVGPSVVGATINVNSATQFAGTIQTNLIIKEIEV